MITIVNYGLGNIHAFVNVYNHLGIACSVASSPAELEQSTHLILPGVGSFDWAMRCLDYSGMRTTLDNLVLQQRIPVLGICVGMQIMADRSDEGNSRGLSWIKGHVHRLDHKSSSLDLCLPHMGWNTIQYQQHPLFDHISDAEFYFLHSYFFSPMIDDHILAKAFYEHSFPAAVFDNNVIGVQFHPEKSHEPGVQLLKNFSLL